VDVFSTFVARYGVDLELEVQFVGDWTGWEATA